MKRHLRNSVLFAAALLLALPLTVAADGGTVIQSTGPVTIARGGKHTPASASSPVRSGDTIETGPNGSTRIRFEDDSVFAIPPDSEFKVDQFQLAHNSTPGSAIFSLLKGGFRTITGLISKAKDDRYEVHTAVATIGVRGTAYAAILCKGECAKTYPPGLYVKTEKGVVVVANGGGKLDVKAGKVAYAESQAKAAVLVKVSPFDDPKISAGFKIDLKFDTQINPPRIEQEPPASPS